MAKSSKIFIFDNDGVVADSLKVYTQLLQELSQKHANPQKPATPLDFLKLFNGNVFIEIFKQGLPVIQVKKILEELPLEVAKEQDKIKPFPQIKTVLKTLHQRGERLIMVTSNFTPPIKQFLKKNGLDYFEAVLGGDIERSKLKKLKKIKKENPGATLIFITDTKGDILEGKKAKVKVAAVSWGWHQPAKLKTAQPDFILKTPLEILDLEKK